MSGRRAERWEQCSRCHTRQRQGDVYRLKDYTYVCADRVACSEREMGFDERPDTYDERDAVAENRARLLHLLPSSRR